MDLNNHSERATMDTPKESVSFAPGTAVGQYRISSLLQEGSQATLFVVSDNANRKYVMRVYFDGMAPEENLLQRFMNSNDPHICKVLAVGEHDGHVYDVVPLMHELPDIRSLSQAAQTALIKDEVEAVKAFHRSGYAHLDVKKEHFMLTAEGHVCLVDLGSAQCIGANAPAFPSQFLPADAFSGRIRKESDYYSLGVALIEQYYPEWLCGKDRASVIRELRDEQAVLNALSHLPERVRDAVKLLLSDNPDARNTCAWISGQRNRAADPIRTTISKADAELIMVCLKKELLLTATCCAPQVYTQNVQRVARNVNLNDPVSALSFLNYLKTIPRNARQINYTNLTEESVIPSLHQNVVVSVQELSQSNPIGTLRKYQRKDILYIFNKQLIEEMDRQGAVISNKHDETAWAVLRVIGIILGVLAAIALIVIAIIALIYIFIGLLCILFVVIVFCAALSS